MLTARTGELDTLTALQGGADDHLTKPFRPRELRARIDTILRRPRAGTTPAISTPGPSAQNSPAPVVASAAGKSAVLTRGELVVDGETRIVRVAGHEVLLTKSEFDLLHELLRCDEQTGPRQYRWVSYGKTTIRATAKSVTRATGQWKSTWETYDVSSPDTRVLPTSSKLFGASVAGLLPSSPRNNGHEPYRFPAVCIHRSVYRM